MQPATPASDLVTCATFTCAARIPLTEATYADGGGYFCTECVSPLPQWAYKIDPPY